VVVVVRVVVVVFVVVIVVVVVYFVISVFKYCAFHSLLTLRISPCLLTCNNRFWWRAKVVLFIPAIWRVRYNTKLCILMFFECC
jgi:hypothetical protein